LVATSIAGEGLDVPESQKLDHVILYEPEKAQLLVVGEVFPQDDFPQDDLLYMLVFVLKDVPPCPRSCVLMSREVEEEIKGC